MSILVGVDNCYKVMLADLGYSVLDRIVGFRIFRLLVE